MPGLVPGIQTSVNSSARLGSINIYFIGDTRPNNPAVFEENRKLRFSESLPVLPAFVLTCLVTCSMLSRRGGGGAPHDFENPAVVVRREIAALGGARTDNEFQGVVSS